MTAPIPMRWDGESFTPLPRFAGECDKLFVVGQVHRMVEVQDRSAKSHAHFFAAVSEAWANLPDHLAERFPTADHLRKFALIKGGWADSRQIVAASKAEAVRLAAFIRPMDAYAVVTVDGSVVTVWTARSQDMRSMGATEFQRSKDAVLRIIAEMIGTTADTLAANAGRAA